MLNSSILDVAIGMAFIYLLLSLIASTVQEAIASLLQLRSANLEHGIRSLFSGGSLAGGMLFVDRLYRHGLIMGLYRDQTDTVGNVVTMSKAEVKEQKEESWRQRFRRWLRVHPSIPIPGVSDPFLLPAYIPARTFSIALLDILKVESQKSNLSMEDYLKSLCAPTDETKIASTSCAAAEAMLSLLTHAFDNDSKTPPLERFRCSIENWYNDSMDRASGWYKKYTQNVLLCIGLILAVAFNVDSINVGKKLWFDKDARSGLIKAAGTFVDTHTPPKVPAQPGASTLTKDDLVAQMRTTVESFNDVSETYLLPVGWHASGKWYHEHLVHPSKWQLLHIASQLAGWSITALALSLGAPFWFDLLNKFMVVRSTVKPSEKSRTEASKDAT